MSDKDKNIPSPAGKKVGGAVVPQGQFLVYPAEDGRIKIDVRLENETVWLTQQHMADLFQTTQQNISLHLQNIYNEGELQRAATHKEYLSVRQEGTRQVKRPLDFYNLDAIISVGYTEDQPVNQSAIGLFALLTCRANHP